MSSTDQIDSLPLKKLPIGIQSFSDIIEKGFIYVDKTEYIYDLLKSGKGAYFLSRPRRFGKSLLVSTLEAIFKNKKILFKDLWITSSEYVWEEYPVIKIDMSAIPKDTDAELIEGLKNAILDNALEAGVKVDEASPERMFQLLIRELVKKFNKQAVILIDEYDDPIIRHISNHEMANKNRDILHSFYKIIKSEDANLRFVFLTGISKFAKTSIFSGLNNLQNISMSESSTALLGYTQNELENYFHEYISKIAEKQSTSSSETLSEIKLWYNGYRFSERDLKVYNPFSTLILFSEKAFKNYWFATGTPTFLINLIKATKTDAHDFEKAINMPEELLNSYEIESLPLLPLMFDSGYLTISNYEKFAQDTVYELSYPNYEVKSSLINSLLPALSEKATDYVATEVISMAKSILKNDLAEFFTLLKSYFASIPYHLVTKRNLDEKYFQLIFYLLLRVTSFKINTEEQTSSGRIDLVLETDLNIYLFEFKVNATAEAALKQIKEKKYYEKYLNRSKKLLLVGVSFDAEEKNIREYLVESIE